jgi:hypothetical protein
MLLMFPMSASRYLLIYGFFWGNRQSLPRPVWQPEFTTQAPRYHPAGADDSGAPGARCRASGQVRYGSDHFWLALSLQL